jgi:hypothetical protein
MSDLLLMIAGPVLWWITKNKRYMILTAFGLLWFFLDVLLLAT